MQNIIAVIISMLCSAVYSLDTVVHDYDVAEMEKAIIAAKASLPRFQESLKRGKASYYALKVALPTKDNKSEEHCWIGYLKIVDGKYVGKFDSIPAEVIGVKTGQEFTVQESTISDWMIVDGKTIYGGYTSRVLDKDLDKDDKDRISKYKWEKHDSKLP